MTSSIRMAFDITYSRTEHSLVDLPLKNLYEKIKLVAKKCATVLLVTQMLYYYTWKKKQGQKKIEQLDVW